jgi:hypothetical protein
MTINRDKLNFMIFSIDDDKPMQRKCFTWLISAPQAVFFCAQTTFRRNLRGGMTVAHFELQAIRRCEAASFYTKERER